MGDLAIKILLATYSVCLPIILGFVIKLLVKIKSDKTEGHKKLQEDITEFSRKIDNLENTIEKLNYKILLDEAMTSRYRIIRSADEIRGGAKLSDEHLEQLGEDIEIYKGFCKANPDYKNHKGQNSMKLILEYEEKILTENIDL